MPVIIPADKYELWLDPEVQTYGAVKDLLHTYEASYMSQHPVSQKLNDAKTEGEELAAPISMTYRV